MKKNILIFFAGIAFMSAFMVAVTFETAYADAGDIEICCDMNANNGAVPGIGETCGDPTFLCDYTVPTEYCCDSDASNHVPPGDRFDPWECNSDLCIYYVYVCCIPGDTNYDDDVDPFIPEACSISNPPCSGVYETCNVSTSFTELEDGVLIGGGASMVFEWPCDPEDPVLTDMVMGAGMAAAGPSTPLNTPQTEGFLTYVVTSKDFCPFEGLAGDDQGVPAGYTKTLTYHCINCANEGKVISPDGQTCIFPPSPAECGTATSTGPLTSAPDSNLCNVGSLNPNQVYTEPDSYNWTCQSYDNSNGTTTDSCSVARDTSCQTPPCDADLCPNIEGHQNQSYLDSHNLYIDSNNECVDASDWCTNMEGIQNQTYLDVYHMYIDTNGECVEEPDSDLCLNKAGIQSTGYIETYDLTRDRYGNCWSDITGSCGTAIQTPVAAEPTSNLCMEGSYLDTSVNLNEGTNRYEWACKTNGTNVASNCSVAKLCNSSQTWCNDTHQCIPNTQACNSTGNATTTLIKNFNIRPAIISTSTDPTEFCKLSWESGIDPESPTEGCRLNGTNVAGTVTNPPGYQANVGTYTLACFTGDVFQSKTVRCTLNPSIIER